ncbi:MAG: hypothetical protein ACI4EI_13170 [Muricoprocola sp.]
MTDDRFDQIMRQALSPRIPDEELNAELIRKMEGKQVKKRNVFGTVIVVAASVAVLGTCGFAANLAYHTFVERTAEYQYEVNIGGESEEIISSAVPMELKLNYVPEDLHYNEDGPYAGKYKTDPPTEDRGLTAVFMKAPEGGINEDITYAVDSQTWVTKDGNSAIFFERDAGYDQVWIAFTGTEYVAQLYVNGFTMEEIKALADGAELVETDTETAYEWSQPEVGEDYIEETSTLGDVVSVDDTIPWGSYQGIEVTIDSLTVQDDFEGITTDSIGHDADYSQFLSSDGTIQADCKYIKNGDGINELDTVVKEETITYKIVVMNLTVTNTGDTDEEVCFCPRIINAADGTIRLIDESEDYDTVSTDGFCNMSGEMFSFKTEHSHRKNNLESFMPGESTTVQIAFALGEKQFEDAYIQLTPYDGETTEQSFLFIGDIK